MFPEGGQHGFLAMFSEGGKTRGHLTITQRGRVVHERIVVGVA